MHLGILFLFVFYHALFSFPLPLFFFHFISSSQLAFIPDERGRNWRGAREKTKEGNREKKKTTNEEINDACVRPSLENGENKGEMHETGEATGKEEKRTDRSLRGTLHCRKKTKTKENARTGKGESAGEETKGSEETMPRKHERLQRRKRKKNKKKAPYQTESVIKMLWVLRKKGERGLSTESMISFNGCRRRHITLNERAFCSIPLLCMGVWVILPVFRIAGIFFFFLFHMNLAVVVFFFIDTFSPEPLAC